MNVGALAGGAVVWKMYVANLKAALTSKNAEISSVEKNRDMWRDKALELEKRSPEFMERMLSERIQLRESEISRLADDKGRHEEALRHLERDKAALETDLSRTRGFRLMLALEEEGDEDALAPEEDGEAAALTLQTLSPAQEIQVVLLGVVGVDSGQLMITDPCYVDDEWQSPEAHRQSQTHELVDGLGSRSGAPTNEDPETTLASYSYEGAMQATLSTGYGELAFRMGHAGAGVVFGTAWGDGLYPVYGELHDGRIVRVYITLG